MVPYYFIFVPPGPATTWIEVSGYPTTNPAAWRSSASQAIETGLINKGILSQRKDLVDGSRVYRVAQQYIASFPQDAMGYFFDAGAGQYRLTPTDPTLGPPIVDILRDWLVWGT